MSRLSLTPPDTIVPVKTAMRMLRIALALKIVPIVLAAIILLIRLGGEVLDDVVLVSWPSLLVLIFVLLPGVERRLGCYYLPVSLALTIIAQIAESMLTAVALPPVKRRPGRRVQDLAGQASSPRPAFGSPSRSRDRPASTKEAGRPCAAPQETATSPSSPDLGRAL